MKKVLAGLVVGILLCAIAGYVMLPSIKQTAYDSGFSVGNKQGVTSGIAEGRKQGIAEIEAAQKRKHDSEVAAEQQRIAAYKAAQKKKIKKVKPVQQNWHVINGKIGDPVTD